MNPIITQYKKIALSLVAVIAMGASAVMFAECKPCAAAAAIRQSIKDAQAAAIAGAKPGAKPSKFARAMELDQADVAADECCAACESGLLKISLARAAVAALQAATALVEEIDADAISADSLRAPREELLDICPFEDAQNLDDKLQALFKCCVNNNQIIRCQGVLAEKCCNKLRHRIHTVKELVEEQIEDSEDCC